MEEGSRLNFFENIKKAWRGFRDRIKIKKGEEDKYRLIPLEDVKSAFQHIKLKPILTIATISTLALYLLSGIYVINPGEEGVIRKFGRYTGERFTEGIHYRLPWPIDRIEKVNVRQIRRHIIGEVFLPHPPDLCPPQPAEVLTGDENIIDVKLMVQYRIKDPVLYLFNTRYEDPHRSSHRFIKYATRASIISLVNNMDVDEVLTIGKSRLQDMIQVNAQDLLDRYRTGLKLVGVNLEGVYPPREVVDIFREVASAMEEKEEKINQAYAYKNTVIPDARGQAFRLINDAEAYKIRLINQARGDAKKFLAMLREYKRDVEIYSQKATDYRLHIETMEKVLPRVKFYVVDINNKEKERVNFRFLKQQ